MSEEDINIIENFLNYNKEKYLSGVEIDSISRLLKAYREQQKEIERLNEIINSKYYHDLKCRELEKEINENWEDKIREIIKHYNNELEHIKNGEEFENEEPMYYWGKVALENLLEE